MIHPYLRYAQALILLENNLSEIKEVNSTHFIAEIKKGLDFFRVKPTESINEKKTIRYSFTKEKKGNPDQGVFLAPNVISTDLKAYLSFGNAEDLIKRLSNKNVELDSSEKITMSSTAIAGDYLSFSESNAAKRNSLSTLLNNCLGTITTLTPNKPCLQYRIDKGGKQPDLFNICLIPDLPIDELKDFVSFFKRMLISKTTSDLMVGNVVPEETGKGKNKKITYKPKRPHIFKGNFPNPPRSSAMGSIALLGAIGAFAKEAEYSEQAKRVLESLKNTEIYLIKYGGAKVFTYNHFVIDLAKEGKLKSIVDSTFYIELYKGKRYGNKDKTFDSKSEYQKLDLFTSRFLQLFNHSAFKDFLAFRAEYPKEMSILFTKYFIKMEKIEPEIVKSARILGKWLNKVAYFAAKNEVKENAPTYWEDLRKAKGKALVELESSTFSAKKGTALIAQAITRAGRLSNMDAPEGAALFMEKTASGDLPLDDAKNLLIAFSRLINKSEKTDKSNAGIAPDIEDDEDLSNE